MPLRYKTALLTLASRNFDGLVRFYAQLLSREPDVFQANVYAEFDLSGLKLGIFRPGATPHPPHPASHAISGWSLCLAVEDLETAIAHLTTLGCPPPGEIIIAAHGREIYAYDPDGNWLIVHEPVKTEG